MRLGKYLSELTKPELEELKDLCSFTSEEVKIIDSLRSGKSYEEIAVCIGYSTATAGRKLSLIKEKIERVCGNVKNKVPIWEKMNLTLEEASEYSNIGINKLREISNSPNCPFVIYIGRKRLIRRKEFEKYVGEKIEI